MAGRKSKAGRRRGLIFLQSSRASLTRSVTRAGSVLIPTPNGAR